MQKKVDSPFRFDKKPRPMPCIAHYFVVAQPQSASEVIAEYNKSENNFGIIVMHYLTKGEIKARICHTYYSKINTDKFEIMAYNHPRAKDYWYHGHRIYSIKYIPMTLPDGSPWPKYRQAEFISYFFDLGKRANNNLDRALHLEKICLALNGQRLHTTDKNHIRGRITQWLVKNGLWQPSGSMSS